MNYWGRLQTAIAFFEIGLSFYFTQIPQIGHADSADLSVHEFTLIRRYAQW